MRDGPWFISNRSLKIRIWKPHFNPEKASLSAVAMWIRMPKLPMEFYNPTVIKKAANKIGLLLRLDNLTALGLRTNFARICIQVDFTKPLPSFIWIGGWKQQIQYEGVGSLCFNCDKVGHRKEYCTNSDGVPVEQNGENQSSDTSTDIDESIIREPNPTANQNKELEKHGPWMLVNYRKKLAFEASDHRSDQWYVQA